MLLNNDLISFTESIETLFADKISKGIVIVNDDDLALFSKDIDTQKKVLLAAIVPSFSPASQNSDAVEFNSLCSFMFLQKKDNKGYAVYLDKLTFTQAVAIQFIKHLQAIENQEVKCVPGYKKIEFTSLAPEPVSIKNYCGYSVDFTTKNPI